MGTIQQMTERVRAEYLEKPGKRLKAEQVRRLCGIEPTMCQQVLDALVNTGFLCLKPDGHYARLAEGHVFRPRLADFRTDTRSRKAS
jgi:hypothetical protein